MTRLFIRATILASSNFRGEVPAMNARDFQASRRGQFIQAQALYYAIQKLSEVEGVLQEKSNIADMQYLLDEMYPGYEEVFSLIENDYRVQEVSHDNN